LSDQDDVQSLQQLSALLNLPFVGNLQTVPAEVIDYGTSDFAATIDISVGRNQGVQLNMPVVAAGGLVGQVVQANHSTLHRPPDHRRAVRRRRPLRAATGIAGRVARTGLGQAAVGRPGAGQHPLTPRRRVRHQRPAGRHLSPAGIPVAQVMVAKNGLTTSQESVTLQPVADLTHLRYVAVLLWGPSS
jgi:hypothetical protein